MDKPPVRAQNPLIKGSTCPGMKTKWLLFLILLASSSFAAEQRWRYQLLEGSYLLDDCPICDRISIPIPMRGSFTLRQTEVTPISTRYAIENADFKAGPEYAFKGSGTLELAGQLVIRQTLVLTGDLQTANGAQKITFTNETKTPPRLWPMIQDNLVQTNGTLVSTISLNIAAAPLQEIWFSTSSNLNATASSGDVLSSAGRIVKTSAELQERFPGPTYENIGLDAFDILPGAGIAFSGDTLGLLNDGDFAFAPSGEIIRWQVFMKLVAPELTTDPGLDALQLEGSNLIYFSTKQDLSSGAFGHGDILMADTDAPTGSIFKKHRDLIARFHPTVGRDYGLDALYIWPSGEIWFSTTEDFNDDQLGLISHGDLLSDSGYIVYRNADLLSVFQPPPDPPVSYGLDALFIVSDAAVITDSATLQAAINSASDSVALSWKGGGRVFQVERAREIAGPWQTISPILPDLSFEDFDTISARQRAFYRLRQW